MSVNIEGTVQLVDHVPDITDRTLTFRIETSYREKEGKKEKEISIDTLKVILLLYREKDIKSKKINENVYVYVLYMYVLPSALNIFLSRVLPN